MLNPDNEPQKPYSFTLVEQEQSRFPPSLQTRDARDRLMKWNLDVSLTFHRFKYTERFRPGVDTERLLLDFFADKTVKQLFSASADPTRVVYKKLSTTVLSMDFFDRLEKHDITVGGEGYIRKCMDEDFHGILVSDKLREMLVNEDSENCEVFNAEDRNELIFQIFMMFVVGGGMCQPEDTVTGYLDMTKTLYKDVCVVQKNNKSGNVEVASVAYSVDKVQSETERGYDLHARESRFNKTFVIVDPHRKIVTCMNNDFRPFW